MTQTFEPGDRVFGRWCKGGPVETGVVIEVTDMIYPVEVMLDSDVDSRPQVGTFPFNHDELTLEREKQ